MEHLSVNDVFAAGGRSGIHVEFSSLSFYFRSCGDLSDEEMDRVCQFLHNRVQNQERTQLYQLTACFTAFKRWEHFCLCVLQCNAKKKHSPLTCCLHVAALDFAAFRPAWTTWTRAAASSWSASSPSTSTSGETEVTPLLRWKWRSLPNTRWRTERNFGPARSARFPFLTACRCLSLQLSDWEEQIRADVRSFLALRSDEKFSGRAVARILHGIGQRTHSCCGFGADCAGVLEDASENLHFFCLFCIYLKRTHSFTCLLNPCQCVSVSHRLIFNHIYYQLITYCLHIPKETYCIHLKEKAVFWDNLFLFFYFFAE